MAREMQTNLLKKLDKIISNKKDLLQKYKQDRGHFDVDFNCTKDEINRLAGNYRNSLKETSKVREQLDISSNKRKNQKDWKKHKSKLDKCCLKLHTTHNEYILAIKVANEHQIVYAKNIVPSLLDSMQDIQESYIGEMKDVLKNIFQNTNWCKDEFVDSAKHIEASFGIIDQKQEYSKFLSINKKDVQPIIPFYFEETFDANSQEKSGLAKDEIALNDLTHEQLKYKLKSFASQLETTRTEIKLKEEALIRTEKDLYDLECEQGQINFNNLNMIEKRVQVQQSAINEKMEELGDSAPPSYIRFDSPYSSTSSEDKIADQKSRSKSLMVENKKKAKHKDRRSMFTKKKNSLASNDDDDDGDEEGGDYVEPFEETPLEIESWFHGSIDRRSAEKLLKQNGDFLVRERSDGSGSYVVSVMDKGLFKHFLFNRTGDGRYKFDSDSFDNIGGVIRYHHTNRIPIKLTDNVLILNPISKAFVQGDKFSFLSSNVRRDVKLGNGHFGDVCKGMLIKERLPVAIKTCREGVDEIVKMKFLEEAEIMKPYNHPNVVKLIGVCNDREPYMILMELMPHGDLCSFLKKTGSCLDMNALLNLGIDSARGMAYLESKNTIHRDLAARNVLVGENYIAKISDFGMSREEDPEGIYTMQTTKEIPIKWTAPEVWGRHQCTSKSDVWSYGVLLWEIFSLGNIPYPGWNNKKTREMVEGGYRMPLPSGTPLKVYQIMSKCWDYDPEDRPTFAEIVRQLET
eukprot:gene19494-21419_t